MTFQVFLERYLALVERESLGLITESQRLAELAELAERRDDDVEE